MKASILIAILFLSSCEMPWQREADRDDAYGDVVRTISRDGNTGDFSRTLNDMMSGPTGGRNCNPSNNQSEGSELFTLNRNTGTPKSIKGEEQVYVNECGPEGITTNYAERKGGSLKHYNCSKKRKVSKEYFNFFNENFATCNKKAFSKLYPSAEVTKISFTHEGVAGDTRHSNGSYHSINRAIDIALFKIEAKGKSFVFDVKNQNKRTEKTFFKEFRQCWNDAIIAHKGSCNGSGYQGTIGGEDKDHKNHMHVSLPFCDGRRGYYSKHVAHN